MSFYKILITKWFYNKISPTIGISITENNYLAHFLYLGSLNSECFTDLYTDFTRLKLKYLITLFQLKIIKFTNELYLEVYNWLINELNSSGYQSSNQELVNLINNLKTNNKKIKTIRNLCNKIILKYKNRPRISSI